MKKVLFVLAFVAVYGVSMAMTSSNVVVADDAQVTIVAAMDDNNVVAPEGEKPDINKVEAFIVPKGNPKGLVDFATIRDSGSVMATGAGYVSIESAKKEGVPDAGVPIRYFSSIQD